MAQRKTIASSFVVGQTTSEAITLNNSTLMGVTISGSKITGTAMTFLVSTDGTNYYSLYDDSSAEVSDGYDCRQKLHRRSKGVFALGFCKSPFGHKCFCCGAGNC